MSNLRAICRPYSVFSSIVCCSRHQSRSLFRVSIKNVAFRNQSSNSSWFRSKDSNLWFRLNQRKTLVRASNWSQEKSPYDTLVDSQKNLTRSLCLDRDAEEEQIKVAYRRLAKFYHPDVYDGKGTLEEGETAEARFIKIQAAYELLMDSEKKVQYDMDNRVNPMKASQAWMEWLMKKRKAFDQRGDMAVAAWAEQQQLDINLRARRLSRSKVDPEEERKILEKEKKASRELFNSTLKRHTLVLKKRDLMRKKAEEDKKKLITQLLAAEGLELDTEAEEEEAAKKTLVRASNWSQEKSPYDTLELDRNAEEEQIKVAYRRLAKFYHPDVYDGKGTLEEGETAEARFIKIQAAYELLMDSEKKVQYDMDNRVNPMKASQAWMEWLMKKRKAFDQRGDMAVAAWAEQQQLDINLRARRLSRSKVDPEEERKILEKEKKASRELFNSTLKRHTLVLKKRDLMRKKAEEDKKKLITQLLAAEGLELDTEAEEEEAAK
ncbi:putative DnaJ domain, Chaperone J-domain superfamily [Arabidopsis thaliana]